MNKLAIKTSSILVSASLLGSLLAPAALADTTLDISDNGAKSDNKIIVNTSSDCTVKQNNNTNVTVGVNITANTGGNTASGNTGDGGVTIETGSITNTVNTTVTGSTNEATDPCACLCQEGSNTLDATIADNGYKSDNKIKVTKTKTQKVKQKNKTTATVGVNSNSTTGNNKAKNNTGDGEVSIDTNNVTNTVTTTVAGGSNTLNP